MDGVRAAMRGSNRLLLKETVKDQKIEKSELNLTKGIDTFAEDLIIGTLTQKFKKLEGVNAFTVFSEEAGIKTFPDNVSEDEADLVIFVDPIDGTEFIESLQGGWCLIAVFDRKADKMVCAVAGDIFLNRLYWASASGIAEAIDFTTHTWFRLHGGDSTKEELAGARVNFLTTKVGRYMSVAGQAKLLAAIKEGDGRINLAWGSNMIIQVAAGYADAAVEFTKGFASYDILAGFFIGEKAGLTILDLKGERIICRFNIEDIFMTHRQDPKNPKRTSFVAAKSEKLARQIVGLINN
jgi:myo-inositol-1(or 4)-monophosphatase